MATSPIYRAFVGLSSFAVTVCAASVWASAEPKVLATIKPVHALVAQVMGATGTPDLLVGGTASPHTYVMKPSDAKKLAAAAIVFRVAETIDPFVTKAVAGLPKTTLVVTLAKASGVTTLPQREGGAFEADHDGEHGHDHGRDAVDGHVWLDPTNAKAMLDTIATTLAERMPDSAATYRRNADAAKVRIDELAAELTLALAPVVGRPYVVFHDAYQYFEKRFGLTVAGSITVNPDIPPSGKRLSQLRAKIASLGVACVFGEPNFDAKVIATVIEGSSARSGTLDPEGASLPPGPELYGTLMRNLAAGLKTCLQPS